jgi:hypothetical protein
MTTQEGLAKLMDEIQIAREALTSSDNRRTQFSELREHIAKQDKAINALSVKLGRPSGGALDDMREQANALLEIKTSAWSPKREIGTGPCGKAARQNMNAAALSDFADEDACAGSASAPLDLS